MNLCRLTVVVACAASAVSVCSAGVLAPPAGPVTPTMKDLVEVEPRNAVNATNTPGNAAATFVISQPGSYYLVANVAGEVGKVGIEIAASNVSLDLNGFALEGVAGSGDGISQPGGANTTIRNGTVSNWDARGIYLLSGNSIVEQVVVTGCSNAGIYVSDASIVRDCDSSGNIGNGITLDGRDCLVSGCTLLGNGNNGVVGNFGAANCRIENTAANSNGSRGILSLLGSVGWRVVGCTANENVDKGIEILENGHVIDCQVNGNGTNGIQVGSGSFVSGCVVNENVGNGIDGQFNTQVMDCQLVLNGGSGVQILDRSVVSRCAAYSNGGDGFALGRFANVRGCGAWDNGGNGITVLFASLVTHCQSAQNLGNGIDAFASVAILDCDVIDNKLNGIVFDVDSLVKNNNCDGNDLVNMLTSGVDSRIEANNVTDGQRGIQVTGTGNLLARNTASGNVVANFDVVAGNYGIYIPLAPGGAVFGSAGGAPTAPNEPWANLSY